MIVYLNDKIIKIKELLQDRYNDMDILKEKPIVFKKGNYYLVVQPIGFLEHDNFLQQMATLMIKYYEIFKQIDLLTAFDYNKPGILEQVMNSLTIFQASKKYKKFIKDAYKFCVRWTLVADENSDTAKKNKKISRKIISELNPAEFIYLLYVVFVFNYDIVKKNTIQFLAMFTGQSNSENPYHSDISLAGTNKKGFQMPKYSESPLPVSVLDSLEEQSKQ